MSLKALCRTQKSVALDSVLQELEKCLLAGHLSSTRVPAGWEAWREGKEWKYMEPFKIWKCEIIANRTDAKKIVRKLDTAC